MTTAVIYDMKQRAFRQFMDRQREAIRKAYPTTGGSAHLLHNWYVCAGDATAEALVSWEPWRKVECIFDRWYAAAEHRAHAARGLDCLWCAHCRASDRGAVRLAVLPIAALVGVALSFLVAL